jgi:hypothetical protein
MARQFEIGQRVRIKLGTNPVLDGRTGSIDANNWFSGTVVRLDEIPKGWVGPLASVRV